MDWHEALSKSPDLVIAAFMGLCLVAVVVMVSLWAVLQPRAAKPVPPQDPPPRPDRCWCGRKWKKAAALLAFLPALACASAQPRPAVQLWALALESPLVPICFEPCKAVFRLSRRGGAPACPKVEWVVTDAEGRIATEATREHDCEPGSPTPRYRFNGTFYAGDWNVTARVSIEGRVVDRPSKELRVKP
jgi:hypothetical protein